jgi:hypothetical protein
MTRFKVIQYQCRSYSCNRRIWKEDGMTRVLRSLATRRAVEQDLKLMARFSLGYLVLVKTGLGRSMRHTLLRYGRVTVT